MIRRYRRADAVTEYFAVGMSGPGGVVVHSGVVGLRGTSISVGPLPGESAGDCQARLLREVEERGFAVLPESEVREVEVCLFAGTDLLNGGSAVASLKRRHHLEELLDEALGWTGNGECTGGDIGVDGMSVYCDVVDAAIAEGTIREVLAQVGLQDRATLRLLPRGEVDEEDEPE